jgi:hypothetical protein
MPKGDYSHRYRPDLLRQWIKEGKSAREIMRELSISPYTLKEHLFMLQREDRTYYEIPGLLEDQEAALRIIRRRRGTICSPSSLCLPDFRPADAFEMHEREGKLILKKIN